MYNGICYCNNKHIVTKAKIKTTKKEMPMSVFALNSELAYEFAPTTNEQILAVDAFLNEL
jgi:hypothetical protein